MADRDKEPVRAVFNEHWTSLVDKVLPRGLPPTRYEPNLVYRPKGAPPIVYDGLSDIETTCFESAVEILLAAREADPSFIERHLTFDAWVQTSQPELLERIHVNRTFHKMEDGYEKRELTAEVGETLEARTERLRALQLERYQVIKTRYGPTSFPTRDQHMMKSMKVYAHPKCDGLCIQIVGSANVAIFLDARFETAAQKALQCDFIVKRFTSPASNQSSSYVVRQGGRTILGKREDNGRDADDFHYEVRLGRTAPSGGLLHLSDQCFPVFAEMRNLVRFC